MQKKTEWNEFYLLLLRENKPIRIEYCFITTVPSMSTNQTPAFSKIEVFVN